MIGRPTAAAATWPYAHRTMAEVARDEVVLTRQRERYREIIAKFDYLYGEPKLVGEPFDDEAGEMVVNRRAMAASNSRFLNAITDMIEARAA